jgi:hypothetical protein
MAILEDRDITDSLGTRMLAYIMFSGGVEGWQGLPPQSDLSMKVERPRWPWAMPDATEIAEKAQHRAGMPGTGPLRSIGGNAHGLGADKLCALLQS